MDKKNEILLESGTNEIEIMEYTIAGVLYGINVAKVKEIMIAQPVKPIPHTNPSVEGIFKPRDEIITVINLAKYLDSPYCETNEKDLFIITNFNKTNIAFRVHTVVGISRISWSQIQKTDSTLAVDGESIATGIAQCNGDLVTILDFEKITAEIAPETSIQISEIDQLGERTRDTSPIYIAEDSILLSKMVHDSLEKAGYTNLTMFPNGQEMWDKLQEIKKAKTIDSNVSLIITDLEMPQMDGHRLTKLIKSDNELKHVPLIIFSSLISEEMRIKGKQLGADDQLSKPEIGNLVVAMDKLLGHK